MSRLRFDDDIFSPVRFDASIIDESSDCSEGSLNSFSNAGEFSLTDAVQNKITLEKSFMKSSQENECSKESKSLNTCPPVLNKNATDKSNAKRQSSKLKLDKIKDQKIVALRKQNAISQQKTRESLNREITLDSHTLTSNASNKLLQKKSKSASLLSKNDNAKNDSLKVTKKSQKGDGQSSKCYVKEGLKSSYDQLVENVSTGSSSDLLENISDTNSKDSSVVSSESKQSIHSNSSVNKKLVDGMAQHNEKLTVNPLHTSYEASIKKMISNSISSESIKIHQLIYMQQMYFYREMDKIKGKLEEQHLITTERLFKVIEELMQMNASLKLALSSKND